MLSIEREKNDLEKSLIEENEQKESVLRMLEHTEKTFGQERDLLMKEINFLKKQKLELQENLSDKSVQLSKLKNSLDEHHIEYNDYSQHLSKMEIQLENVRKDNLQLRAELNENRSLLISRDNLIKDLQHQLSDPSLRKSNLNELKSSLNNISMKLSMTNDALNKESLSSKQLQDENFRLNSELNLLKSKIDKLTEENSRLSSTLELSLKQNESDLILAKKNSDLAKLNLEKVQAELENEKSISNGFKSQVEQFKLQERLEIKNQANLKTRIHDLEDSLKTSENANESVLKNLQNQLLNKQREMDSQQIKYSQDYNQLLGNKNNLEKKLEQLKNDKDDEIKIYKQNLELSRTKLSSMKSEIDDLNLMLSSEKNNVRSLQLRIDNYERQEHVESNLINSLKSRISELEGQIVEFNNIREPDLLNQIREASSKINFLEDEKSNLNAEHEQLNLKIKNLQLEIERLKQFEYLIQSQKWSELSSLAENMRTLSNVMTTTIKSSQKFEEA
ncbi:hypothetical protein BpHYR1_026176 [Brachionus plicatilis]|nr:hypothetical protein BpHYR1_026176 [Brachionus plicatilis]